MHPCHVSWPCQPVVQVDFNSYQYGNSWEGPKSGGEARDPPQTTPPCLVRGSLQTPDRRWNYVEGLVGGQLGVVQPNRRSCQRSAPFAAAVPESPAVFSGYRTSFQYVIPATNVLMVRRT